MWGKQEEERQHVEIKSGIIMHPEGIHNFFPAVFRSPDERMCLLILAHRAAPGYPLLVAANRDEFHARPTTHSEFWPDHPQLLAGKDLEQGGTWMGITRQGHFAAITNCRDPARTAPAPRSRGELPLQYLTGTQNPTQYLEQLRPHAQEYAGFNLLLGDGQDLWYFTNSGPTDIQHPQCLQPGIYGLSNAYLDAPWPKVLKGKQQLAGLLNSGKAPDHGQIARLVADRNEAAPGQLAQQGLDGEMEQVLSAQFIVTDVYGTRATTTLIQDDQNRVSWREESFDAGGIPQHTIAVDFDLRA